MLGLVMSVKSKQGRPNFRKADLVST